MATFRTSISFPMDGALPRDAIVITPHFNGTDAQALANALKTNIGNEVALATHPFTIKVYDALTPPPSYPLATAEVTGTPPNSGAPREVALCVSYYTTYNRPRYRGRLYFPATWLSPTPNVRPTTAVMTEAIAMFKRMFGAGLPAAHNLVVFSRREGKSMGGVSDIWVDDEWDTVRSRGLKGTQRQKSTFP